MTKGDEHSDKKDDDKAITVIVNGQEVTVPKDKKDLTYDEVVALAFPNPPTGENVLFTITYRKGRGNKSGTVDRGDSVHVQKGMIFDVTPTDRS